MTVGNVAAPGGRKKEAPLLCCLLPKSSLRWSLKHSYKNYHTHKPYLAFFLYFFSKFQLFMSFFIMQLTLTLIFRCLAFIRSVFELERACMHLLPQLRWQRVNVAIILLLSLYIPAFWGEKKFVS